MKKLCIVIPSYNRVENVINTLKKLLPQLTESVSLIVLDNCSSVSYEDACYETGLVDIAKKNVRFIRNRFNVGMSANFMRAFEVCDGEWLWMVADDDDIKEDAISKIMLELDSLPSEMGNQVAFIKFSSDRCQEKEGRVLKTLQDLLLVIGSSYDYFNSFIFISNGLYKVDEFSELLPIGYQYTNTGVPHLMLLLYALGLPSSNAACYLSPLQVASYVVSDISYSYGFIAGLGVGAFKNFPFDLDKKSYQKLEGIFAAHNDYKVAIDLFYYARYHANPYVARRLVSNYEVQIRPGRSLFNRVKFKVFCLLLFWPWALDRLIKFLTKCSPLLKRDIEKINLKNKNDNVF